MITASFECNPGPDIVVRLAPTTGRPLWTWRRPAGVTKPGNTSVIGAAQDGNAVLVATPAAPSFTRAYQWAAPIGAGNQDTVVLALDAATGQPRWSAPDSPEESFVMTDGVVCAIFQSQHAGSECRDDTSGAATMPALIPTPGAAPQGTAIVPFVGADLVVTTVPAHSGFIVRITRVRGSATAALARLGISVVTSQEPSYQPSAAASRPLPQGSTLLLLQLPGHTETLAMAVPAAA